jgi:peptidoglycan/LPS O-acetylase OafA/YrhL
MTSAGSGRLEPLDGLRGLAALWVFVGHALNMSGAWIPILGRPLLAVDLFMMLSGALMVYQTNLRDPREPLARPDTWLRFWLRRFFRIAPVFYLAFVAAMLMGPWLYDLREAAGIERSIDWARYHDHGPTNVLLHLSFIFGVVPGYADRSPLPDWSIGLEMQFYLVFPFVLLLLRRVGFAAGSLILLALVGLLWLTAGDWLSAFSPSRPAALPLRLNIFLAGMLVMRARDLTGRPRAGLVLAAIVLGLVPLGPFSHWSELVIRGLSVAALAVAMIPGLLPAGPLEALAGAGRAVLSWTPLRRLGDVSYGVYLIHLLALVPAVALVSRHLPDAAPLARAGIAFIGAAAVVYPAGWLIYRFIENPGISLGRRVVGRLGSRSPSRSPT